MFFKNLVIFFSMACLSACSLTSGTWVIRDASEFNKEIARAQNEMILLNVLRLKDRGPFYISSINQVRGALKLETTLPNNLAISGSNNDNRLWPSITANKTPSFDLSLLDDQEFYNGFLAPVSSGVVDWYQRQGWLSMLLWHLLIAEFAYGDELKSYQNTPVVPTGITRFTTELYNRWYQTKPRASFELSGDELKKERLPFDPARTASTEWFVHALSEGFELKSDDKGYYLSKPKAKTLSINVPNRSSKLQVSDQARKGNAVLRSPYGVMFYLGDLVNYWERTGSHYEIHLQRVADVAKLSLLWSE